MPRNPKKPPTTRPRVRRGNQEDADKFRGELIAAALGLFQNGGLSAVTMRAVADTVGVSAMTPYRYFASRAELLTGIWASVVGAMHEQVAAAVASARGQPPSEKQRASCSAFLGYWESNPDHYRLVYLTEGTAGRAAGSSFAQAPVYGQVIELVQTVLAETAAQLGVGMQNARLAGEVRFTMLLGYLHESHIRRRQAAAEQSAFREAYIETIIDVVERCLVHGASAPRRSSLASASTRPEAVAG